jgi:predicted NUDIX family phosphoesterase
LSELDGVNGFKEMNEPAMSTLLVSTNGWFGPRHLLEHDERYRQLIPYVILHQGNRVVTYRRGQTSTESRLRGKRSIGFGGHVTVSDIVTENGQLNLVATLRTASLRELEEELILPSVKQKQSIGILCMNNTSVSRVHLGVVELWSVDVSEIRASEACIGDVSLMDVCELVVAPDDLEEWSRHVAAHLVNRWS